MSLDPVSTSELFLNLTKNKAVLKNTPKPYRIMYRKLNWQNSRGTCSQLQDLQKILLFFKDLPYFYIPKAPIVS